MAELSRLSAPADLVSYCLGVFRRRWQLIVAVTLVAALVAALSTELIARIAPEYRAQSAILLTPPKYEVNLEPRIRTVDSGPVAASGASRAREEEIRVIAFSPNVLNAAQAELASRVPGDRQSVSWKMDLQVSGSVINVIGVSPDPTVAQAAADAAADAIVARLNEIYGQTPEDRGMLARKLDDVKQQYEEASQRLADFTKSNRIDELSRRIDERTTFLGRLTSVSEQQNGRLAAELINYYLALAELDSIARDAAALREQVQNGGQSSASSAAHAVSLLQLESRLINLGTRAGLTSAGQFVVPGDEASGAQQGTAPQTVTGPRVFADSGIGFPPGATLEYRIDIASLANANETPEQLLSDVDALLRTTDIRRAELSGAIDRLSAEAASGSLGATDARIASTISTLTAEIQQLQAELVAETARRDALQAEFEAAKAARAALDSKLWEADIAAATTGGVAMIASSAIAPSARAFPPPLPYSVAVGAFAGLLIGVAFAFFSELAAYWSRSASAAQVDSSMDIAPVS